MTARTPPAITVSPPGVKPSAGMPCDAVGTALREQSVGHGRLSREEQYQRDLAVIEKCELAIEHQAGCPDFFGCMGELRAARG